MNKQLLVKAIPALFVLALLGVFVFSITKFGHIEHPGLTVYKNECAQCHGENGEGIKTLMPPIANSDFAVNNFDSIPCWLKNGLSRPIIVNGIQYEQTMYPSKLNDIQIANVINYINETYLHTDRKVNSAWVNQRLKDCK
jgi:cytochrome c